MRVIDKIARTCTDKKSYSLKQADEIIDKYAKRKQLLFYYKCYFCCRYHLSRQIGTVRTMEIIGGKNGV
jgi:hypothetical protein